MKAKKMIAMVLGLVMALTMMSGCGQDAPAVDASLVDKNQAVETTPADDPTSRDLIDSIPIFGDAVDIIEESNQADTSDVNGNPADDQQTDTRPAWNEAYHIPVLLTWDGVWLDQDGEEMRFADSERYFKSFPEYGRTALEINRELTDLHTDGRDFDLERVENWTADVPTTVINPDNEYAVWLYEQIDNLRADATYIKRAMPKNINAYDAYVEWAGLSPKLMPICKDDAGNWVDQYGHIMTGVTAWMNEHPEYRAVQQELVPLMAKLSYEERLHEAQRYFVYGFLRSRDGYDTNSDEPDPWLTSQMRALLQAREANEYYEQHKDEIEAQREEEARRDGTDQNGHGPDGRGQEYPGAQGEGNRP